MKQADTRKGHDHAVFLTGLGHLFVLDTATGLGHVTDTDLTGHIDRIPKGEKGITAQGETTAAATATLAMSGDKVGLVLCRQGFGDSGELGLPLGQFLGRHVAFNVPDAGIDPVLSLDALLKGQGQDLGVLPQQPGLYLAGGQLDAIDAGLLTGSHPNHHAIFAKADRIGLRILDADRGQEQIPNGIGRQLLVGRDDIFGHVLGRQEQIVAFLHKGHAVDFPVLDRVQ